MNDVAPDDRPDVAPDDRPRDLAPPREGLPRVVEQAAEVLVFAPIGFVVEAPRLVPELARRGRREVEAARTMGGEVLDHGHRWLAGRLRGLTGETRDALRGLGHHRPSGRDAGPPGSAEAAGTPTMPIEPSNEMPPLTTDPGPGTTESTAGAAAAGASHGSAADIPAGEPRLDAPDVSTLAIPDYDNLSASQVVPRLAALDPPEREAVRRYEQAGRSRKTILNRIAQLQGG